MNHVVGLGTIVNVVAILVGSAIGVAFGHRLSERTRQLVTDGLGLVVLLVAGLSCVAVADPALVAVVGSGALLVVLAAVLLGGLVGSALRIEQRLESLGERLQRATAKRRGGESRPSGVESAEQAAAEHARGVRFVEGFVTASLVYCIGPLGILGALSDGLGDGIDQLALKAVLDGFASIAFAASLGWGVAASALAVGVYQGLWTVLGWSLGGVLGDAEIAAMTATGGLLLVGVSLRLLRIREIAVGDLLPALVVAPAIVWVVGTF